MAKFKDHQPSQPDWRGEVQALTSRIQMLERNKAMSKLVLNVCMCLSVVAMLMALMALAIKG